MKELLLLQRFCKSACEIRHKRQQKEAPPLGSHKTGLSRCQSHQQQFQRAGSQTTDRVLGGLLGALKGFESEGMTITFDAIGKGKPNQRIIVS